MNPVKIYFLTGAAAVFGLITLASTNMTSTSAQERPPLAGQVVKTNAASPASFKPMAPSPMITVSPFAAEFVTTGAESESPGDHYVPSNGDGTFGARSDIPGLATVDGTDVADMDNDGDNDFVTCEGNTGQVFLFTNQGGGSFTTALVATGVSTEFSTNLRIADFNKDGLNDFVVGHNRNVLGTKVYIQGPVGTFAVSATLDTSWTNTDNNLFGVAAGNINGDANPDIVMLGYEGTGAGQVRFYAGDGAGNFAAPTLLFNIGSDFGETGTVALGAFDLEGDGDLDLVVGGGFSGNHYVYTNNGAGSFTMPAGPAFDVNAQTGVDAFDADGDGDHDLVVAAFGPGNLQYVENLGGTLAPPVVITSLTGPSIGVGAPALNVCSITCPVNITRCNDPGLCGAIINFAPTTNNCGTVTCTPPSGAFFPVGTTSVTCTTNTGQSCSFNVTINDCQAPAVSCAVTTSVLGPPNHNMINVGLSGSATDNCPGPLTITVEVFGDEDDESPTGDGNHSPDAKSIAVGTLRLRSERKGDADGRVYLIVVKATDMAGNVGVCCTTVVVPHDQKAASLASVQAQAAAAKAFCQANGGAPPPGYFVIGDGPVIGPKQ